MSGLRGSFILPSIMKRDTRIPFANLFKARMLSHLQALASVASAIEIFGANDLVHEIFVDRGDEFDADPIAVPKRLRAADPVGETLDLQVIVIRQPMDEGDIKYGTANRNIKECGAPPLQTAEMSPDRNQLRFLSNLKMFILSFVYFGGHISQIGRFFHAGHPDFTQGELIVRNLCSNEQRR